MLSRKEQFMMTNKSFETTVKNLKPGAVISTAFFDANDKYSNMVWNYNEGIGERYSKFALSFNFRYGVGPEAFRSVEFDKILEIMVKSMYNVINDGMYEKLELEVLERFRKEKGIICIEI